MGAQSKYFSLYHAIETKVNAEDNTNSTSLQISKNKTYEVVVVSTVSSGKSTFINALIGDDFLPSQNQACTSRTIAILDNDKADGITTHLLYPDGNYKKVTDCDTNTVSSILLSESDSVADIIVECSIPGVRNVRKSLLIVDTPGVNNSANLSHEEITHRYLETMKKGLVIYVMNSTQIGTTDDSRMVEYLKEIVRQNPDLQVLFLLNKADEIDSEKEPVGRVVTSCADYLSERGFPSSYIFPVSSDAALLFKKAINRIALTKAETARLKQYYEKFKPLDFSLSTFIYKPDALDFLTMRTIGSQSFLLRNLYAALENTGILAVEREIEKRIIDQINTKAPKITKPASNRKRGYR